MNKPQLRRARGSLISRGGYFLLTQPKQTTPFSFWRWLKQKTLNRYTLKMALIFGADAENHSKCRLLSKMSRQKRLGKENSS
jgi:hypothetical protein